jgi:transcriptional regulator with XRE-family HTH domain
MTEYIAEASIGARIKAARKARGIRSIRELAKLLGGTSLTESVLENIEAGRKADLPISELLNLSHVLRVPPALLLAPLGDATLSLDLPNLSPSLLEMTPAQFDGWMSGDASGAYRATSPEERSDLAEVEAFREFQRLRRELVRQQALQSLEDPTDSGRVGFLTQQMKQLVDFLEAAGWVLDPS